MGIVSKHYKLVQHTDLFERACEVPPQCEIFASIVSRRIVRIANHHRRRRPLQLLKLDLNFHP